MHGDWKGRPIQEAIEEAKLLRKLPEGLELRVMVMGFVDDAGDWVDGYVTLSNRTLYVAREAGLTNVPIVDVGPKGLNQLNKLLDGRSPQWETPEVRCK